MTTTVGKAVSQVIAKGRLVLKKDSWSLTDLADAVVDPLPDPSESLEAIPVPPLPKPVELTTKVKEALTLLPTVFENSPEMTERRAWNDDELSRSYALDEVITALETVLAAKKEANREGIRHTMDVRAEEAGIAVPKAVRAANGKIIVPATPRDKTGHYVLAAPQKPERLPIPDTSQEWSREFKKGTLSVSGAELDRLHKADEVSREDYLAMTVSKRVFDEAKAKAACAADEQRWLILKAISSRTAPSTSLTHREVK
jgi:hypothetical protein